MKNTSSSKGNDNTLQIQKNTKISPKREDLMTPLDSKVLPGTYHVLQSFNNCGPASLSMALSYYNISENQDEIGRSLRPYQIPGGDNDDKSVTLEELAEKSKEYGFIPFHRPAGNINFIKYFITYDMPVITRTWTKPNEDIGHYRIVKGYDEKTRELIQDDSLQGKNLRYTYEDFNTIWEKFNYEYLVLVPKDKVEIARLILGSDSDQKKAWGKTVTSLEEKVKNNPTDPLTHFNLSVAYYNVGNYQKSTDEFEKAEIGIPFRTLWYQIEPIEAYYELGEYDRVLSITSRILNNQNRAFSELYLIRGNVYLKQGELDLARSEFEKAVFYNSNFQNKIPSI